MKRPIKIICGRVSDSSKALADAMGVRRTRRNRSRYIPRCGELMINWGTSEVTPDLQSGVLINTCAAVRDASCKKRSLEIMGEAGVCVPKWTDDREKAQGWVDNGGTVFARHLLRSHSGRGIERFEPGSSVSESPLYTLYRKKLHEFRVHVVSDKVIDVREKRRIRDEARENPWNGDNQVRNRTNGWTFAIEDIDIPPEVLSQAKMAVVALGLQIGAVDVGWAPNSEVATVYEVNTAPGLEGQTLDRYAEALTNLLHGLHP